MDSFSLLLSGLLFLVAVYFLLPRSEKSKRFEQLVSNLGMLPTLPIVGSVVPVILTPRNHFMELLGYYFKTYGVTFSAWMGPIQAEVFTCQAEIAEVILSNPKHIQKGHTYEFLHPWLGTGLLTASGLKWHTHRKIITPTFHFSILETFIEVFTRNSATLAKQLKKELSSKSFDVFPYVTKCTLDIICESAMGVTVRTQEGENPKYIAAIYELSEQLIRRKFRPWLYPDFVFALSPSGRKCAECLKILHTFTDKVITERRVTRKRQRSTNEVPPEVDEFGKKSRKAFLDMLLDASESGAHLSDKDIREEVDTFMFEGHDTTTAGICWAIYLLGNHPDIQERVYKEQEEIFQGSDRPASMRDLQEMKYLERVIKETLRLYPSVPIVERELKEDITVGDVTIPAGVDVALVFYYMHRDPKHFPNPENFDPDNFLPEVVSKRNPYAYAPFSAGPRNCIGQKFAMFEEKVILSTLIRNYKIETIKQRNAIKVTTELILRPDNGIYVSVTPRDQTDIAMH